MCFVAASISSTRIPISEFSNPGVADGLNCLPWSATHTFDRDRYDTLEGLQAASPAAQQRKRALSALAVSAVAACIMLVVCVMRIVRGRDRGRGSAREPVMMRPPSRGDVELYSYDMRSNEAVSRAAVVV